jgi:hypothetical protein
MKRELKGVRYTYRHVRRPMVGEFKKKFPGFKLIGKAGGLYVFEEERKIKTLLTRNNLIRHWLEDREAA